MKLQARRGTVHRFRGQDRATGQVSVAVVESTDDMTLRGTARTFWAPLIMWIGGTFHYINSKHLHRYVNEFAGCYSLGPQDTERMMREFYAALIR
ncbi:MAG: hypothetical protein OXH85_10085 [Truepera sp.]|nr:hypothetical protein [Truepera sp.]